MTAMAATTLMGVFDEEISITVSLREENKEKRIVVFAKEEEKEISFSLKEEILPNEGERDLSWKGRKRRSSSP